MKKRIVSFVLAAVMLSSLIITVVAAEPRATSYKPSLTFNGTTANCSITIIDIGKPISAVLELWHGSIRVAAWSGSATSRLIISEECTVTKGETYTLKVSGTISGVSFTGTSVTGVC